MLDAIDPTIVARRIAKTSGAKGMWASEDKLSFLDTNEGYASRLVGSPDTVIERMRKFHALGVDCFHLILHDQLFNREVLPALRSSTEIEKRRRKESEMKLGLLYEVQIPKPWTPGIEARTYGEVLEQVVLADKLGWGYVWAVEHHLLPQWSHCPAPEVLFGALSQITKRIRIGHGIALLPRNFNHALRVAERAAVLDILSGGRVELGTGRAVTLQELDGFEVNPDDTQAMWAEAVEVLVRSWKDEPIEYKGRFYNIPKSYVVPEADSEAASADVAGRHQSRDFQPRGAQRPRDARFRDGNAGRSRAAHRRIQGSRQACGTRVRRRQ